MRSFKDFLNEAATTKAPSTGKGARVTGKGLQLPGVNFSQMGYGYRSPMGPSSLTQWHQDYSLEQGKTELNKLSKAAESFQAIFLALNSDDPDEVQEHKNLYGQYVYTEGTLGNGAWIRSISQSDGHGRGIMHRGIAKGYQFSAPEIEFLKQLNILTPSKDQWKVKNDVLLDFSGDLLENELQQRSQGQNWKIFGLNTADDVLGRMASGGMISNQGTNLDAKRS